MTENENNVVSLPSQTTTVMTREEFMKSPSAFDFELNPLDVHLIKAQKQLLVRMKNEAPANGYFVTITEEYVSRNPEREYGRMTILIREGYRGFGFDVVITVYSKDGQFHTSTVACHGDWELVCRFVDSYPHSGDFKWDFFSSCKANALWTDYCITHIVKCIEWNAKPKMHTTWMSFFYGKMGNIALDAKVCDAMKELYSDAVIIIHDMPTDAKERTEMLVSVMQSSVVVKILPMVDEFADVYLNNESVFILPYNREDEGTDGQQMLVCWDHESDIDDLTDSLLPMLFQTLKNKELRQEMA